MIGHYLVQDQRSTLTITPEWKQSIHMLSLSGYELAQYLQEQALENPVLELDYNWGRKANSRKYRSGTDRSDVTQDPMLNVRAMQDSLEAQLLHQLRLLSLPAEVFRISAFLAGNLDDAGYLDIECADVCEMMNVSEPVVDHALKVLQSLEPAGIGCRDLRECLLLQIARDRAAARYACDIVANYLPLLANGSIDRIAYALCAPSEGVSQAASYIRNLNPRPGLGVTAAARHYIIPDAVVHISGEDVTVALHSASHPSVMVNQDCREWVKLRQSKEATTYVNDCFRSAQWIVRCMEMRRLTLSRVVSAMMNEQRGFLERGIQGLRPMNLCTIASVLDMHESTVSRAIHHKFVQTPHGTFPLKFFFAASLPTADGSGISSRRVKTRIKEFVVAEDRNRPYSDQQLVNLLRAEGVRLSRRTVTKYREELRIPSSTRRKHN
ncbi:RNA polymerase factor sigma-54 [Paenibacillus sp. JCM 10914]|uniref:RNA polymerase factor sigma-54 n=1 Tax=Paenibacillus sp. JCM 10914 TaxID=1236974 RepID=UPI0003CCA661|nr:RNA polymerase factor sigma-54 [Paenibacillus sp. JCM 10914]GAE07026.1 RNA polymerase sigma-54 factor RpoN [Paenibacillus sp. JCM 10914]